MMSRGDLRWAVAVALAAAAGCAAPARRGDPALTPGPVRLAYVNAPMLRLRPVAVGGLRVPVGPLQRTAERISRYTGRPVVVEETAEVALESGDLDIMSRILEEVAASAPLEGRTVLVVPVGGIGVTGYLTWSGKPPTPMVVLKPESIAKRSGLFVKADSLAEWTLTHEIGHVLGVPANAEHTWIVPGLGGNHCTHPECGMYTGFDWRVLWTGMVRGWPMEFCGLCTQEIKEAREAAAEGESR